MRRALGLSLLVLIACPAAWAADGCTVDSSASPASIACTGDVPETTADGGSWEDALASLQSSSEVALDFSDIDFSAAAFQRMLTLVAGAGASNTTGTVTVTLDKCTMQRQEVEVVGMYSLAGSTQMLVTLQDCQLTGNAVNLTASLDAENNLDVTVKLLGTDVSRNTLMAVGGVGVGGTAKAALSLAEATTVTRNTAFLAGLLAGAGDADLAVQLASSNVTGNTLELMGAITLGGNATLEVTGLDDPSTTVAANEVQPSVMVFEEEPLVAATMDMVLGLAFNRPGFNLSGALSQVQGDLCATLSGMDLAGSAPGSEADLSGALSQLASSLCSGDKASPSFDLASQAPALEALLNGTSQAALAVMGSLESVLGSLLGDQGALGNGTLEALLGPLLSGNGTLNITGALDTLLPALLSSPQGDAAASGIADLLNQFADWLNRPIGGGDDGKGDAPAPAGGSPGLGAELGGAISSILGSLGGQAGQVGGNVGDLVQSLVDSLTGSGSGASATPEDLLAQIISAATGGSDNNPLQGVDVSQLLPILAAVVRDPQAREALPGLLQGLISGGGSGGLDTAGLGPLLSAILKDPQASQGLPSLLGLLGKLGIQV